MSLCLALEAIMPTGAKRLSYADLNKYIAAITQIAVELFMEFGQKNVSFMRSSHPKYLLRDSLLYRANSVRFHACHLQEHFSSTENGLQSLQHGDHHKVLSTSSSIFAFLFDDLVFNICSLCDYTACTIGYLYSSGARLETKWNGLVQLIPTCTFFEKDSIIASAILENHKLFVDDLFAYRSDLIHNKMDGSDVTVKTTVDESGMKISLLIGCPVRISSKIKVLSKLLNIEELGI